MSAAKTQRRAPAQRHGAAMLAWLCTSSMLISASGAAQPAPDAGAGPTTAKPEAAAPKTPAIQAPAAQARTAPPASNAATPGSADATQGIPPAGARPTAMQARLARIMGQAPPVATAEAAPDEPAGSIRVTVVDAAGKALPDVTVTLGILATGGGGRSTKQARTDAQGQCRFTGLKTGSSHAYRPRVQHQGARYSAPPFQLPPDHGYRSRIRRLPITREREALLQFLGQSVLEFRDKQVSVQQRAELVNLAARTYVFPPKGLFVPLPAGFKAFQSERGMHDVRITHGDGGMRLFGSLPPGRIALGWAFELDYQAPDATFALAVPWPSYRYRVAVAARAGMQLDVAGFPAAQEAEAGGRQYWVTQIQRRPSDAPLDTLDITVRGIPGPGPWRWWALGGALLVLALGLGVASRRPRTPTQAGQEEAQTQLVTALVQLTQAHKAGDIGPQYYREQYERGRDALALLLAETAGDTATPSPRARANQPRKNATSS